MKFADQVIVANAMLNMKSPNGGLTDEIRKWAGDNAFHHVAYYHKTKSMTFGRLICMDCLKEFNTNQTEHGINAESKATVVCPHCGRTLVVEQTKRTTYSEYSTFCRHETVDGIDVMRVYECNRTRNISWRNKDGVLDEVLHPDHWFECVRVFSNGKSTEYASRPVSGFWYNKTSPWSGGELEYVKKQSRYTNRQAYIDNYAEEKNVCPIRIERPLHSEYISLVVQALNDELKSAAKKSEVCYKVIRYPMFETMVKAGQLQLAAAIANHQTQYDYNYYGNRFHRKHATTEDMLTAAKICIRNHYTPDDPIMYIDYLDDMRTLDRDFHNAHFVCPSDLKAAHALSLKAIRNKEQREDEKRNAEERQRKVEEARKHDAEYRQKKAAYLDIAFDIPEADLHISVIPSASAMQTEGNRMNHCVGGYWNYGNSLILSCRIGKEMKRHATIEIKLDTFKVAQVRAANNGVPEYKRIIENFLEDHMDVFRKARREQERIDKEMERIKNKLEVEAIRIKMQEAQDKLKAKDAGDPAALVNILDEDEDVQMPQCIHGLMAMAV